MVTRRLWWAAAGALLVLGACDSPRVNTDGGSDGGEDACEGLTLCATAGTSCDGDSVVTCAANADGCLVETTAACGADQTCEVSGGTAECVDEDPCDAIPAADRCTTEGRSCDGDTLAVCAPNADGCLVLEETDCAAADGGACDESGTMPMCVVPVDPCDGVADACTTAGTSCDGDSLVTCAPNAFGCLVETTADCSSRAGGTCDDTATAECTFTGDPCDGVTECATAGVSCDGPELVACAEDAFGCMVETRTDCTDTTFGFCDADGAPAMCSTAATDPCMGLTECGTEPTRACSTDSTSIEECSANAFGCFVTETTSCTDTDEVCSDAGGMAVCVDPCSLVDVCPSATYCDGEEEVTCAADTNGCLVESSRGACAAGELCDATAGACVDACPIAQATVIDCASGTVNGDTAAGTASIDEYECQTYEYASNEQVWRFQNAARAAVTITATRLASSGDFDLYVLEGDGACDTTAPCIDSSTGTTATETVEFIAEAGVASYIAYDRYGDTVGDPSAYTLEVTCQLIVCGDGVVVAEEQCDDGNTTAGDGCSDTCMVEPTYACGGEPSSCHVTGLNGTCAAATAISSDSARYDEDLANGGARPMDASCGGGGATTALYYSVTIPAGTRVDVRTDNSIDLVLFTQDACTDTVCTFQRDEPEALSLSNTTTASVTQIVGVMGWSTSTTGTFDIAFDYVTLAANGSCASATPLGTGVTGVDLSTGGDRPTGANCGTSAGPVLYYEVDVPANSVTTVTGTSTGAPWDLTLRSLDDCSGACVANVDSSSTGAESISFTNTTASTVTRLVAVGADSTTTFGTFDLSSATTALATNTTCAAATVVTADVTYAAENTTGGSASSGCTPLGGPTLWYSVTVPAGQRVTATIVGQAAFDAVAKVRDTCGATACTRVDVTGDGGTETVVLDNLGTSEITRIIAVNEYASGTVGGYSIAFAYTAVPYTVAPITAACVTTGTWTTLTRSSSVNDATTPVTALPFGLTYFGEAVTHFSTNDNGIAQLWASSTGTPSNEWSNTPFPRTGAPNGTVAAFWDDLLVGPAHEMRTQTTGTAGSQVFVIEWLDSRLTSATTGPELTFQAHFYESTNVIEYHYCTIGAGSPASGSSATVGIENTTGTDGITVSHNTAGAIVAGSGYRFTPN